MACELYRNKAVLRELRMEFRSIPFPFCWRALIILKSKAELVIFWLHTLVWLTSFPSFSLQFGKQDQEHKVLSSSTPKPSEVTETMAQAFPHAVWFGTDFAPKQKRNLIYLTSISKSVTNMHSLQQHYPTHRVNVIRLHYSTTPFLCLYYRIMVISIWATQFCTWYILEWFFYDL